MMFRRVWAPIALLVVAFASGCCHDGWCCRHPCAPRCRPACCPQVSCGCESTVGFAPAQSFPPPPAPIGPASVR